MSFTKKLQYLLVKKLQVSNNEAKILIIEEKVFVNTVKVRTNIVIKETDKVELAHRIVQEGKELIYVALNKPRGIESTLSTKIPNNLTEFIQFNQKLFPVGRLDKDSEGLILLTNDGYFFNKTINPENEIEKEYLVTVNKLITSEFIKDMGRGVQILGKTTFPCFVEKIDDFTFKIVLIQGLNRQIRRMCYQLNYMVTSLKRLRIGNVLLKDLPLGKTREITKQELFFRK
jgi:23S rRNA pseudouridine2604 synthase